MNDEEKFDKLLRFKLSEREFPFDELNWDDAEQLIIRQESRRKTVRFTMIFAAGIVAGALMMLPFMLNNRNTLSTAVVTNSTTIQNSVAQNSSTSPGHSIQTTTGDINTNEKAPQPVQPAFVEKDIRTGTGGNSSQSSSVVTKVSRQRSSSLVSYVNPTTRLGRRKQTHGTPAYIGSVASSSGEAAASGNNNETVTLASSKPVFAAAPENSAPPNISDKAGGIAAQANTATNNNSSNNVTLNTSSESNKNTSANNNNSKNNLTLNNASEANKNTPATASTNKIITKKDSTSDDVLPPLLPGTTPRYIHSDYSSNLFSIYAGGAYSLGWGNQQSADNGSSKQANGITPLGGVYYTHYFGNISMSLGIGYSELTNLDKTYTSSLTQYDFGADATVTTVTPHTVYYLAFPLKVQYDLDSKNILGLNCNYLIMLTTSSTLNTYQQTYFSETPISTQKQNGYTQGFSNYDWQFGLSYTRMLSGRLGLSIEFYHDLGYVENNSFSNLTQNTKNNSFRLILSYQLIH